MFWVLEIKQSPLFKELAFQDHVHVRMQWDQGYDKDEMVLWGNADGPRQGFGVTRGDTGRARSWRSLCDGEPGLIVIDYFNLRSPYELFMGFAQVQND